MTTDPPADGGPPPSRPAAPNLGLRERNRRLAMREIQDAALDLFDAQGYDAVTVEQVAAAAAVSPSTVYRYFGTKDRLVLHDEEDRLMIAVLLGAMAQGDPLIIAARRVIDALGPFLAQEGAYLRRRFRYVVTEPSVRAALRHEAQGAIDQLAAEVCSLRGREAGDLEVTLSVTMLVDALLVAVEEWARREPEQDVTQLLGRCLDTLERGISL